MVRMLDVLEDYCRARQFRWERLDGGIRGAERQSAIGTGLQVHDGAATCAAL
jgi:SNF2 family DNA or RNA helicase